MKELEDKVHHYLIQRGTNFIKGSISYVGIMKNEKQLDGEIKDVHLIRFLLSVSPSGLEDPTCYINADVKTKKLDYLITPQMFEKIDFDD